MMLDHNNRTDMKNTRNTNGKPLKFPIARTPTVAAPLEGSSNQTAAQPEPLTPEQQKQLDDWQAELNDEEETV
jgi:hypothetical protein